MSFTGKLHEISFYGLISTIICLSTGKTTVMQLLESSIHVSGARSLFCSFLFWTTVLFIPIAIVGALLTKYRDHGEGLLFTSNRAFVIIFAHIAEEILGLILTPFWFLKDLFTRNFDFWKVVDYILYFIELAIFICGIFLL